MNNYFLKILSALHLITPQQVLHHHINNAHQKDAAYKEVRAIKAMDTKTLSRKIAPHYFSNGLLQASRFPLYMRAILSRQDLHKEQLNNFFKLSEKICKDAQMYTEQLVKQVQELEHHLNDEEGDEQLERFYSENIKEVDKVPAKVSFLQQYRKKIREDYETHAQEINDKRWKGGKSVEGIWFHKINAQPDRILLRAGMERLPEEKDIAWSMRPYEENNTVEPEFLLHQSNNSGGPVQEMKEKIALQKEIFEYKKGDYAKPSAQRNKAAWEFYRSVMREADNDIRTARNIFEQRKNYGGRIVAE